MRGYTGDYCQRCGFNPETYEPTPTALPLTTVLHNQYVLGVVLGKGGFGITYIGYDNLNCRRVAIKEFFPDSLAYRDSGQTLELTVPSKMQQIYKNSVEKFYNEAVILSKLQNISAIVDIYDFFYENNTAYIVMEFVDGTSIDKIVMNQGGLDVDITLTIYYPIIQALKEVHEAGILHRDISPSNIMLDDKSRARLIDFGSSRAYSHEMSTNLTVILKKGFAPIEQYTKKGRHGPVEDVYAICASMYYTITGTVPPAAPERCLFDSLQPIHNFSVIPPNIENIILKGLSVQAEDRYSDMAMLSQDIDRAIRENQEIQDMSELLRNKSNRKDSSQIVLLATLGAFLIILCIILILSL